MEVVDLMCRAEVRPDCSTIALIIEDRVQDFWVGSIHSSALTVRIVKINPQNKKEEKEEWMVLVAGSKEEKMSVNIRADCEFLRL